MGKKRSKKRAAPPDRVSKMVSTNTSRLIRKLADIIREEQRRDSHVSDNDAIRFAIMECLDSRDESEE